MKFKEGRKFRIKDSPNIADKSLVGCEGTVSFHCSYLGLDSFWGWFLWKGSMEEEAFYPEDVEFLD